MPVAEAALVVATAGTLALPDLSDVPAGGHAIVRSPGRTVVIGADDPAALRGPYALARDEAVARLLGSASPTGTTTSAPPSSRCGCWTTGATSPSTR